jgi:hypothetical protein
VLARHAFDVATEAFGLDQPRVGRVYPHAVVNADAAAGADHQGSLAAEVEIHVVSLPSSRE